MGASIIYKAHSEIENSYLGFVPGTKQTPHLDELAQVVGIVIGEEQGLSQQGLAGTMRNGSCEVCLRIQDELNHRMEVLFK